jgi:hypothetical protein
MSMMTSSSDNPGTLANKSSDVLDADRLGGRAARLVLLIAKGSPVVAGSACKDTPRLIPAADAMNIIYTECGMGA